MKKISLVLVFVILLLTLLVTNASAIDMNLINSIRQNELNEAENLSTNNATNNALNNALTNNNVANTVVDNNIENTNTPSASVNTVMQTQSEGLGVGEIIDILLIVVGVLIILLGIAILIRMKH